MNGAKREFIVTQKVSMITNLNLALTEVRHGEVRKRDQEQNRHGQLEAIAFIIELFLDVIQIDGLFNTGCFRDILRVRLGLYISNYGHPLSARWPTFLMV